MSASYPEAQAHDPREAMPSQRGGSAPAGAALLPQADWVELGEAGHFVQFYETDRCLALGVGDFLAAGLLAGAGALVIATASHRAGIEARLSQQGIDLDQERARGRFVALDAAETLERFMVDGFPDAKLFYQNVGQLVSKGLQRGPGLRAFGEMVALLWAEGRREAALELEALWNDLGKGYRFALFCAYPLQGFSETGDADAFADVCQSHVHVLPSETYTVGLQTPYERLREIAFLQQKSLALETEVEHRRQTELALQRSRAELESFVETAPLGMHWVGADGTILWANAADYEPLGYRREEYVGHSIVDFHADPDVIADILARLQRDESLRDFEARLRAKDGTIRTVLIDSSVLWDEGRFVHTQCIMRDVTAQRMRMQDLAEAEAAFRALTDSLPVPSWVLEQGRLSFINRAGCALFGRSQASLAESWQDLIHPEDLLGYLASLRSDATAPVPGRIRCRDREGRWTECQIQSLPRLRPDGSCGGFVSSVLAQWA